MELYSKLYRLLCIIKVFSSELFIVHNLNLKILKSNQNGNQNEKLAGIFYFRFEYTIKLVEVSFLIKLVKSKGIANLTSVIAVTSCYSYSPSSTFNLPPTIVKCNIGFTDTCSVINLSKINARHLVHCSRNSNLFLI